MKHFKCSKANKCVSYWVICLYQFCTRNTINASALGYQVIAVIVVGNHTGENYFTAAFNNSAFGN